MTAPTLKQPAAFLPITMSLAGLALVLIHAARFGVFHEADEGTSAHLFQILMVAEVPVVAFFALKWLPQAPRKTILILALQAAAAIAAFASVYFLT